MRLVLYVRESIPGLAEAGAHVTLRLTDPERPMSVVVEHGPDALDILVAHHDALRPLDPVPGEMVLMLLYRMLGYATPPSDHPSGPRLVP